MNNKYFSTLKFIFIKATLDLYPNVKIKVLHSLNNGVLCEVKGDIKISENHIAKIKEKMNQLIHEDLPITKKRIESCVFSESSYFENREDLQRLVEYSPNHDINLYELEGYRDFFHNELFSNTGYINVFDIIKYKNNNGIIIKAPLKDGEFLVPKDLDHPKLATIFCESERWGEILNVSDVGALNKFTFDDEIGDLIRVNEALHEKKLAYISDEITRCKHIKLITVAGPSSSGKTTFTKRLAIQLRANGIKPIVISLDNYYSGRDYIPLDENGEKDFESIYGLDLELLNEHLVKLIAGEEVEVPRYNFHTGQRESKGDLTKLSKGGILLIEGIHGLNEILTSHIEKKNKFKIYISCLTQLNIDDHNRIPTSEVRKLRRIVRDSLSRGTSANGTLDMWDSIRRGEEKNIFPYQEEADAIFNSSLVYELGVLKKYAIKELEKIDSSSTHFDEAKRLIKFLNYFKEINKELVPDNSLLKEFIGGSYFYKY
ncbi:MAG: nucleoside kinase [Psychrilyobacter sp.]|nr:nucleoside kinase [Psychrilyobacter sp.]